MAEFVFSSDNDGRWIMVKYTGNDSRVEVPEFWEGNWVTSIGDYAFCDCRMVQEIVLPDSVDDIGRHAFYDCRGLRVLHVTDRICSVGDGALKNCDALGEVRLKVIIGKAACIRGILAELPGELGFRIQEAEGETALLVFPKFNLDFVENTSAKIINQVTYGAGVHYRECLTAEGVDYAGYDSMFPRAQAVGERESVLRIALGRLAFPYRLQEEARQRYLAYVEEDFEYVCDMLLTVEDLGGLRLCAGLGLLTEERISVLTEKARSRQSGNCLNFLMDFKNETFGMKEKEFRL